MVTVGGSNPREVDLIFDHNCNIRVRRRTVRRRPLALRATAPPRSKQKQASSYATTARHGGRQQVFLVAIVRQSSRIESLKTTSGGLGHFFKLGACRVGGWEAAWPAERGDMRKRGGGSQSSRQTWQYKPAIAWLSYLREPRSRGAPSPSAAGAPRPSAARGALLLLGSEQIGAS